MNAQRLIGRGVNLRGSHVTTMYKHQVILGEVRFQAYLGSSRGASLKVTYLNGDPWPFTWYPAVYCEVLERTYERTEE